MDVFKWKTITNEKIEIISMGLENNPSVKLFE